MKTSYHYFTFIIISLLLHYLFFYLIDINSESEQALSNTQLVNTQPIAVRTITAQTNKIPNAATNLDESKLDTQIDEAEQSIDATTISADNIMTTHKAAEIDVKNQTLSEQQTKIEAVYTPALNTESLNTLQTQRIQDEQAKQKHIEEEALAAQQAIVTQPELIITSTVQSDGDDLSKEQLKLSNAGYSVNLKTHKATEAALLKADLFEQEIVNLPKLPKKRSVKKKVLVSSTTSPIKTPKPISNNLTTANTMHESVINDKAIAKTTIKTTAKTAKPTFKPKVDTELLSLSDTIKLPEAVAISGKKPSYPEVAAKLNKKGQVVASMTVLPTGSTKEAEILKSSGSKELDQAVIEFIVQERFMPSLQGQDKVSSKQVFSFSYE
ncbi:energy transducer TonB [Psychromonas sp. GE-S-Ul-11]|uniref:energy transducer TonB n=1 Tax=Psychromonas sp. GE-S-Ul-11 TaxID=3241170 RepID=UPI00390C9BD8